MKNFLMHMITDTHMGHSTAVIVKADNLEEADNQVDKVLEHYGNGDELADEPFQEVSEKELETLNKFGCVEVYGEDEEE